MKNQTKQTLRERARTAIFRNRHDHGLVLALERIGGYTALSYALGNQITYQGITHWRRVPEDWIVPVERATGVPRERLRPDLYR